MPSPAHEAMMELKVKGTYRAPDFDLFEGNSTLDLSNSLSDERKAQMLNDFPDLFEEMTADEIEAAKVVVEPELEEVEKDFDVESGEDKLDIESKETEKPAKAGKGKGK